MDPHEEEILTRFIEAALSSGKRWEKACHEATYALLQRRLSIQYIDDPATDL